MIFLIFKFVFSSVWKQKERSKKASTGFEPMTFVLAVLSSHPRGSVVNLWVLSASQRNHLMLPPTFDSQ